MPDSRYDYEESFPRGRKEDDFKKFLSDFSSRSPKHEAARKESPPVPESKQTPLPKDSRYELESSHYRKEQAPPPPGPPAAPEQGAKSSFPRLEDLGKEVPEEARMFFPLKEITVKRAERAPVPQPPAPPEPPPVPVVQQAPAAPPPVRSEVDFPPSMPPVEHPPAATKAEPPKEKLRITISPLLSEEVPAELISVETRSRVSLMSLFGKMINYSASDLHLTSGASPVFRINGDIFVSNLPLLSDTDLERILYPLLDEEKFMNFTDGGDLDFSIEVKDKARFRVNYFKQQKGISAVFRLIPLVPPDLEFLGLPRVVKDIAEYKKGLILVTGPTGSGKTTTLAAMINHMNKTRNAHVVSIEDPIEYVHQSDNCLITHREVGAHALTFAEALQAAIREDPDVIMVGELRDLETMDLAIKAAEMGFLVLTTLHTVDAASSIDRILDTFPSKQQEQIRLVLSQTLKAIIAQQLVKVKDLEGRCPAVEILIGTKALTSLIREGKTHQIPTVIQTGGDVGMQTMDQAFIELIKKNTINKETVRYKISDMKLFERAGIFFK